MSISSIIYVYYKAKHEASQARALSMCCKLHDSWMQSLWTQLATAWASSVNELVTRCQFYFVPLNFLYPVLFLGHRIGIFVQKICSPCSSTIFIRGFNHKSFITTTADVYWCSYVVESLLTLLPHCNWWGQECNYLQNLPSAHSNVEKMFGF